MKTLLAALAFVLVSASASAFEWKHGRWEVSSEHSDNNQPYCYLFTAYQDRGLAIAYAREGIRIVMHKDDWNIPKGVYPDSAMWNANGNYQGPFTTQSLETGTVLIMEFGTDSGPIILEDIAKGLHLIVTLPKGEFHMPLYGSANAVKALEKCLEQHLGTNPLQGSGHSPV